ncbi:hypothetical protein TrRE_jg6523 [Triparma retinervis]|uniref:Uncharacterized protein n=1 Tax=Triparma retinervis TaxID=2557542 RepID=A0A9W6ZYX6_9STRA|nr:hypothetical protein TrRE_jg6523 [Triparma retinervis]
MQSSSNEQSSDQIEIDTDPNMSSTSPSPMELKVTHPCNEEVEKEVEKKEKSTLNDARAHSHKKVVRVVLGPYSSNPQVKVLKKNVNTSTKVMDELAQTVIANLTKEYGDEMGGFKDVVFVPVPNSDKGEPKVKSLTTSMALVLDKSSTGGDKRCESLSLLQRNRKVSPSALQPLRTMAEIDSTYRQQIGTLSFTSSASSPSSSSTSTPASSSSKPTLFVLVDNVVGTAVTLAACHATLHSGLITDGWKEAGFKIWSVALTGTQLFYRLTDKTPEASAHVRNLPPVKLTPLKIKAFEKLKKEVNDGRFSSLKNNDPGFHITPRLLAALPDGVLKEYEKEKFERNFFGKGLTDNQTDLAQQKAPLTYARFLVMQREELTTKIASLPDKDKTGILTVLNDELKSVPEGTVVNAAYAGVTLTSTFLERMEAEDASDGGGTAYLKPVSNALDFSWRNVVFFKSEVIRQIAAELEMPLKDVAYVGETVTECLTDGMFNKVATGTSNGMTLGLRINLAIGITAVASHTDEVWCAMTDKQRKVAKRKQAEKTLVKDVFFDDPHMLKYAMGKYGEEGMQTMTLATLQSDAQSHAANQRWKKVEKLKEKLKKATQKVDELEQKLKAANLTDDDLEKLKKERSSAKEDAKREEEAAQNRSKAISKAQPSNRAKEATQKVDELEQKLKAANLTDGDLEKLKKELSSAKEAAKREKEAAVLHRLTLSLGGLTRQYNTVEQAGAEKGDVVYITTLAFKNDLIKEAKDVKNRFVNTQVARDTLAGKLRDLPDGEEQEKNDLEKKLMEAEDVLEEIAESVNQTRAQMKKSQKKRKRDLESVIAKAKKAKEGSMMS